MKRYDNQHVTTFLNQLRAEWPNLSVDQSVAYAVQRDAGIAAANRLVSTKHLTDTQCRNSVKAMATGREAIRMLTLQGLPWAYQRACRMLYQNYDKQASIDLACASAMNCAMRYEPAKGQLSTLVAADVRFKALRLFKSNRQRVDNAPLDGNAEICEEDRGHIDHDAKETRRQKLLDLIDGLPNERERMILTMRADGLTLRYIADYMGVTKERIRQLVDRAIRTLKVQAGTATGAEKDRYCSHMRGLQRESKRLASVPV